MVVCVRVWAGRGGVGEVACPLVYMCTCSCCPCGGRGRLRVAAGRSGVYFYYERDVAGGHADVPCADTTPINAACPGCVSVCAQLTHMLGPLRTLQSLKRIALQGPARRCGTKSVWCSMREYFCTVVGSLCGGFCDPGTGCAGERGSHKILAALCEGSDEWRRPSVAAMHAFEYPSIYSIYCTCAKRAIGCSWI